MHLPRASLIGTVRGAVRPSDEDEHEPDGHLFTPIRPGQLTLLLESAGFTVLQREQIADNTRGITWHLLLAEKSPLDVVRGLERIQVTLAKDKKTVTYKLALVRALCHVGRAQPHLALWYGERVFVPLLPVAVQWLAYYWPFFTGPAFIAQIRGETEGGSKPVAFRSGIRALTEREGLGGLYLVLRDIEQDPGPYLPLLKRIGDTIRVGPITFSGTRGPPPSSALLVPSPRSLPRLASRQTG
jgi:hypothetical protein